MRTTVDVDAPLLARARRQAAKRGKTLSVIVCEALTRYLAPSAAAEDDPFEVVTCGETGGYAPTPAEMASEIEHEDARLVSPRTRRRGRA